ncbi:uncharacterized protein LOC101862154 [Aplysia californica]|uniref:Uncharacterized protein LOC101862154 n=1 Tax=Aplysia californica TaxID=6500 RepID=A0ABM1A163_APLCA|nr:uncharacterized protein LOC101862154 [Aplysia californica]
MKEEQIQHVKSIIPLPDDYAIADYDGGAGGNFKVTLRFPFTTEEEVVKWKSEFEKESNATFRVSHSRKCLGKVVNFNKWFLCQHSGTGGKRYKTRKTGCQAGMHVTIKKVLNIPSKSKDEYMPKLPTKIIVHWNHNHPVEAASRPTYRDVQPEVKERLMELFRSGHTPGTAVNMYKTLKRVELGEEKYQAAFEDGAYFPSYHYAYRLYTQVYKPKTTTEDLQHPSSPPCNVPTSDTEEIKAVDAGDEAVSHVREAASQSTSTDSCMVTEAKGKLQEVLQKLSQELDANPQSMIPAVNEFCTTFHNLSTQTALLSALHAFGKYSGVPLGKRKRAKKRNGAQLTTESKQMKRHGKSLTTVGPTSKAPCVGEHVNNVLIQKSSGELLSAVFLKCKEPLSLSNSFVNNEVQANEPSYCY